MIGYLKGQLIWSQNKNIIIVVNGVGYSVEVTDPMIIPAVGDNIELYTYTYVREDVLSLFGFKSIEEKELFTILLGISGIGPRAAVNILSDLPCDKFINAIMTENVTVLKQISGIGPKTAQRLILELKSKLDDLSFDTKTTETGSAKDNDELYEALTGLGYSSREINKVLTDINFDNNTNIQQKLKTALSYLGREH
ncbi:MAG: Holliday junction branch migration protein RuvA [Halothermotrichaceae bacterium]